MTLGVGPTGGASFDDLGAALSALRPLERSRVSADAVTTARALLGALLVRDDGEGRRIGRIVETEAYTGPGDRASHARAGKTPRTAVMFGPPGHAYVYLVYGLHHCLNIVCGPDGQAAAVLVRALEPIAGLARMRQRRGRTAGPEQRMMAGPARACQALDIDRTFSGADLIGPGELWLAEPEGGVPSVESLTGPRIGVEYAGPEWATRPWRFGIAGSPALSRPFPPGS